MGSVGQDAHKGAFIFRMASEEEKPPGMVETPPPAYVEPITTAIVVIDKDQERPESAWQEPAPARDPQRLNTHLQIEWDDLIGEPDGVKTMDCAWDLSKKCYTGCLGACYTLATVCNAPFLGCYLGIGMAYMVFVHVWFIGPIMRMLKMTLYLVRKLIRLCLAACMDPYVESAALIFSNMKVRHQEVPKRKKAKDDPDAMFLS